MKRFRQMAASALMTLIGVAVAAALPPILLLFWAANEIDVDEEAL